jgi:hypothetical protein
LRFWRALQALALRPNRIGMTAQASRSSDGLFTLALPSPPALWPALLELDERLYRFDPCLLQKLIKEEWGLSRNNPV